MSASNSVVPLSTVKYLDPRIDVLKKRMYAIERGGQKVSYIPYQTNSTGNNAMQFSVIPPSRTTFVDRQMFIQASIQCKFTANVNANNTVLIPQGTGVINAIQPNSLVFPAYDAPRSYPLSRGLQSASLQVGNASLSMNTSDVIDPLLRIMKKDNMYFDQCPSALDNCQRYEEMAGSINPAGAPTGYSYGNNVLGNNIAYLANGQLPRGCYKMTVGAPQLSGPTTANYTITQLVTFEVMEPVFLSPLCYDALHSGLIGLQNINLLYNFSPTASQLVWSGTPKSQVNAGTVAPLAIKMEVDYTPVVGTTGISRAQLWVGFISPSSLMSIPPQINYNYDQVECYTSQGLNPIQYNGEVQFTTQNIQLKVVPKTILVGVRKQLAQCGYQDPHAYFQISKASFNFDNNVGLLSSCNKNELYAISKKNGLNYDYASWLGEYDDTESTGASVNPSIAWNNNAHGVGSLLVINPAEDFGLGDSQASGVAGAYNFQVNLTVKCINKSFTALSSAYECIVVVINDGELAIDVAGSGNVTSKIGLITEADVLSAPLDPNVDASELEGNGWLSGAKSFLKKALPIVKDVAPLAIEAFKKAKAHLDDTGSALIGSGVGLGYGKGVGRGGRISKLSLKDRLN
jgi:hypothetical protein